MDEFRRWAGEAIAVVRELWATFPGPGDMAWRADAMTAYRRAGLDPAGFVDRLRSKMLRDLPSAKGGAADDE
jgi:hypothetical protein